MTDNTATIRITESGCYLDSHRGHYIQRDMIGLAVSYGYIIGPFEKYAVDMYDDDNANAGYPHEAITELADEALDWLNSGQEECDKCDGTGFHPHDGDYWTHKDDPTKTPRCKKCSGTG